MSLGDIIRVLTRIRASLLFHLVRDVAGFSVHTIVGLFFLGDMKRIDMNWEYTVSMVAFFEHWNIMLQSFAVRVLQSSLFPLGVGLLHTGLELERMTLDMFNLPVVPFSPLSGQL
jgi:hypothetical protein